MDARTDPRQPRVVDLRRSRAPEIEIVACETYDFLLTLHVALASPERDYSDYDIGSEWCAKARERCKVADPDGVSRALPLFRLADPGGLHATLISLVAESPAPRDVPTFLAWLGAVRQRGADRGAARSGRSRCRLASAAAPAVAEARQGVAEVRGRKRGKSVAAALRCGGAAERRRDAGRSRCGARGACAWPARVGGHRVRARTRRACYRRFARQARELERQRAELPLDQFIRVAMHNVEWQRHVGLRRIIFAPSYFSGPAVFYHFRRGTLTFCLPVQPALMHDADAPADPRDPNDELLGFFMALGDPTRLRILRLLSEREMYLTELAERLDLTKATTKHHMVKLRAAQLVTLYDRDRMTFYALVPEVQRRAAQLLSSYLSSAPRS